MAHNLAAKHTVTYSERYLVQSVTSSLVIENQKKKNPKLSEVSRAYEK